MIIESHLTLKPCGKNYKSAAAIKLFAAGAWLTIPAGFLSDGASAPIFTLNTLGLSRFDPRLILAAFAHDYAYRTGELTKKQADKLFFQLLIDGGISRGKASILYNSVKAFGGKHYHKKK